MLKSISIIYRWVPVENGAPLQTRARHLSNTSTEVTCLRRI